MGLVVFFSIFLFINLKTHLLILLMSYYFIAGTGLISIYGLYKMLTKKKPDAKTTKFVKIKRLTVDWEKGYDEIDEEGEYE